MTDVVVDHTVDQEVVDGPAMEEVVEYQGIPGGTGPQGLGVLVLNAVEPVPPGTPINTVIFRRNP